MQISFGELKSVFIALQCQNDAGDESFFEGWNKRRQCTGKLFFLLFKPGFEFGVQDFFKSYNTPGTYKKNIGCCFRVTCFIYLKEML